MFLVALLSASVLSLGVMGAGGDVTDGAKDARAPGARPALIAQSGTATTAPSVSRAAPQTKRSPAAKTDATNAAAATTGAAAQSKKSPTATSGAKPAAPSSAPKKADAPPAPDAVVVDDDFEPLPGPPSLAVPAPLEETDVPDTLDAMGVPVHLHATRTKTPIDELDLHFRKEFYTHGLFIPDDDDFDRTVPYRHVTGLDVETNTSFSVIFQPNPDGSTTVIAGTAYLHAAKSEKEPPFVPAYPNARRVLVSHMEGAATLTYAVDATPDEVTAFYRELFTKAGYVEASPLQFQHDGEVFSVFPKRRDGETSVVVLRASSAHASSSPEPR